METAAIPISHYRPFSWRAYAVISIMGFTFYLALALHLEPVLLATAAAAVVWSLFSYEATFAFLCMALHGAAMEHPVWDVYISPMRWVFLFMLVIRPFIGSLKGERVFQFTKFHLGVFGYTIFATVTSIGAFIQPWSAYRTISLWWLVIALSVSVWRYMDSREKFVEWLKISVYVSTAFLLIGFLSQEWWREFTRATFRFKGVYFNPNMLALGMIFHLPASFLLWRYEKLKNNGSSFLYLMTFLLGLVALILSGSRASIGGLIIGSMLAMAFHYRSRLIVIIALVILFVGAGYTVFEKLTESRFFEGVVLREQTVETFSGRTKLWETGLELFKQRPLFGWGFGVSDFVLRAGGDITALAPGEKWGSQAHNSFIRSILEVGIVGTLFVLMYLIFFPLKFLLFLRKIPVRELHMMALMLMVILVAGLLNSFFEAWLFSVGSLLCFSYWWCAFMVWKMDSSMDNFIEPGDTPREMGILLG